MKVLKFGGTSVANAENILKVIDIVKGKNQKDNVLTVVSALGGVTNSILECGQLALDRNLKYELLITDLETKHVETAQKLITNGKLRETETEVKNLISEFKGICHGIYLLNEITAKTRDYLLGFGERLSAIIIAEAFDSREIPTIHIDARELIITDENYGNANVDFDLSYLNIREKLIGLNKNVIVNGFIASSAKKKQTTLGRGGSDYTAAIIASAINADVLEIWTDVNGVMTADPNIVSSAYTLERLSYEEAMELSHFGAKVIYPPTIQPVLKKGIPVLIKNTFAPDEKGTFISKEIDPKAKPVKGLSHIEKVALLTLTGGGMIGVTGIATRLFSTLSLNKINVIFITQASSEHTITIGIDESFVDNAVELLNIEFASELQLGKIDEIQVEEKLSIVALVGDNMKESIGLSGKTFHALGSNGVNVRAIAQGSTERNISIVIKRDDVKKALNVLHESFFLSEVKKMHLFIIGVGNVGNKLLAQIEEQKAYLKKEFKLEIRVAALANSRKMLFNHEYLDSWQGELMEQGEKTDLKKFIATMKKLNYRNSVFVDNTANEEIAKIYAEVLNSSISVVASNKIAASSEYSNYKYLNELATKRNVKFLYETNVAAGLPVIRTIRSMIKSGDRISKIEAVLSGSLNFIFNNFNDKTSFDKTVKMAMDEGYTEPDPRIDLSGKDVMRKILILARESGAKLEFDEIENEGFIPAELFKKEKSEDFLEALKNNKGHFEQLRKKAEEADKKLRFTAIFEDGKASVGLLAVGKESPYYQLDGKDNIVMIYSERYKEQPLIVKGAGAGAEVTASGVFADIMSIANE
ncbi:MAG: bifunctional aspartate kinase/homoserine dehydrogenase I [Bacteroidales bacterium]|nr:bifunctional aspartate kinase/homoserine dehydrogenase I [Bacteroidales bacterium]